MKLAILAAAALVLGCDRPIPALSPTDECAILRIYRVASGFEPEEVKEISDAFLEWEQATRRDVCFVPSSSGLPITPVIEAGEGASAMRGRKAVAAYSPEGIKLLTPELKSPGDIRDAMVHEIGHWLGLAHYEGREESCMRESSNGPLKVSVRDVREVRRIGLVRK